MISDHLVRREFLAKDLNWVPQTLAPDRKWQRAEQSEGIVRILAAARRNSREHFITSDEY
jgi:hypothetical protein